MQQQAVIFEKLIKQHQNQLKFDLDGTTYQALENIGTGAYGVVCSAVDTRNGGKVAVKKIPNAFAAHTVLKRTLREVRILRHFRHDNVIAVVDMFQPANGQRQDLKDVYIVFDLMETDLHHIIHSKQPLTDRHVQYFMYQIFNGLRYVHSAKVIHRDLKPSNLMVNGNCALKIGDFGMARVLTGGQSDGADAAFMTQYVATRWYRAPELLFSMLDYSFPVDLWSAGCVLAEMLNRRQLFPGKDHISQIKLVVSYLGTPDEEVLNCIPSDLIKNIIMGIGRKTALPWKAIVHHADSAALDLLSKLLPLAPWRRTTVEDALKHEYFNEFRKPEHERLVSESLTLLLDDVERLDADQLKQAMLEEVQKFRTDRCSNRGLSSSCVDVVLTLPSTACSGKRAAASDVEMLSASIEGFNLTPAPRAPADNNAGRETVRAALIKKIIDKQRQHEDGGHVDKKGGKSSTTNRKRRKSHGTATGGATVDKNQGSTTQRLTEQDKTLLERWQKLQQKSSSSKLAAESSDRKETRRAAEHDVTCDNEDDGDNECEFEEEAADNELKNIIVSSLPSLDSSKTDTSPNTAQLMEDWIIATNVNPEFLKEIEKHSVRDIAMKLS